jgi:hypothetical protein
MLEGVREAHHDVLDCGVLHFDVGRTGGPICFDVEETFSGLEAKENGSLARGLWRSVSLF